MTFAFLADLFSPARSRKDVGFLVLAGAALGCMATVAAGYYDMGRAALGETHEYVDVHMKVGWILLGSLIGLTIWRWRISRQATSRRGAAYIIVALLVFGLTLFQGWFGGELVYSQGAGVAAAGKGTEPPSAGLQRLTSVTRRLPGAIQNDAENRSEAHHH
jgi:uncharacterized membrane protein